MTHSPPKHTFRISARLLQPRCVSRGQRESTRNGSPGASDGAIPLRLLQTLVKGHTTTFSKLVTGLLRTISRSHRQHNGHARWPSNMSLLWIAWSLDHGIH